MENKNEVVYGYIYNHEGKYAGPIGMKFEPETISSFIMRPYMAGGKV